jgi:hypothetical protein
VRRRVLYNILIEFGVPMKLIRLIKACLNEAYSKVRIGKHLSDSFPIQNGLKQGDALFATPFQLCFRICHLDGVGKPGRTEIKWDTSASALADDVNLLGDNIDTIKENIETLIDASKEVGLEINRM